MAETSSEPTELQPYPGLRYYQMKLAGIFAGRERDVEKCASKLLESQVLILHGRTGCGKSSFLRAGVKPKIERARVGTRFEGNPTEFDVIRSTRFPLRELSKKVLTAAEIVISRAKQGSSTDGSPLGRLRKRINDEDIEALQEILNSGTRQEVIDEICEHEISILLEVFMLLGRFLRSAPIFVIDQAEEVFTLSDIRTADGEEDEVTPENAEAEERRYREETSNYFKLLSSFVEARGACRLVISLRTEYKGLFDDNLPSINKNMGGLQGFYLKDLDEKGLEDAVLRPTLSKAQWEESEAADWPDVSHHDFGFSIDKGVVDDLIAELLSDKVPAGGVLPTLQVACLRLWRMARDSRRGGSRFRVRRAHFQQLGKIQDQIEEYLAQSLEECCAKIDSWPKDSGRRSMSDKWHEILVSAFVRVEADGRAVTKSLAMKDFISQAIGSLGNVKRATVVEMVDFIKHESVGLLREDQRDGEIFWTLGHDSLALALNKWNLLYGRKDMPMMMRMGMSSIGAPDEYKIDELFPKKEDRPHEVNIVVQQDFGWDHQLPFFAMQRGFAERLGINIVTNKALKARNLMDKDGEVDWPALRQKMADHNIELEKNRMDGGLADYAMVATDWNNFPGAKDYKPDADRKDGLSKFTIRHNLWQWSDILVTNVFYGNGLIGEGEEWRDRLREVTATSGEVLIEKLIKHIRDALIEIRENNGVIRVHAQTGVHFLEFAAELVGDDAFKKYIKSKKNLKIESNRDYQAYDQLLTWLLEDDEDHAERRPKYIVGSAQSRTLALQAGLSVYFGTDHLSSLARKAIDSRKSNTKREEQLDHIATMAEQIQRLVVHNLWQIGIPATQWNVGINKPIVLRLASLGYFSAEYIRTNSDQYVMYLHEFMNDIFRNVSDRSKEGKGMRLSRLALKNTWRDCFSINKFDEVGPETYDPDSIYAFSSQHSQHASKSVAAEIYAELMSLRGRTLEHFTKLSQSLAWLNSRANSNEGTKAEQQKKITRLWDAYNYREAAWRNYRILNFYDSERLMAHAAHIMQREIEEVSRVK